MHPNILWIMGQKPNYWVPDAFECLFRPCSGSSRQSARVLISTVALRLAHGKQKYRVGSTLGDTGFLREKGPKWHRSSRLTT
jgi:hypothetical protein